MENSVPHAILQDMIDIHSHIVPGVDDGSDSLDESIDMMLAAYGSGVTVMTATPHCYPGLYENYADGLVAERYKALKREIARLDVPVKLVRGMECMADERLPEQIRSGLVWTLNGTSYLLMEFQFGEDPDFCAYMIGLLMEAGIHPVIAHPERYFFIQRNPEIAFDWCTGGCALQLNKGSVLGRFGQGPKRTAESLLRHGLAACLASDAHGAVHRTADMADARLYIERLFGEKYAKLLTAENPKRILQGRPLLGYRPIPYREEDMAVERT